MSSFRNICSQETTKNSRGNDIPFVNKSLSKEIMKWLWLRYAFAKTGKDEDKKRSTKQRIIYVSLLRKKILEPKLKIWSTIKYLESCKLNVFKQICQ